MSNSATVRQSRCIIIPAIPAALSAASSIESPPASNISRSRLTWSASRAAAWPGATAPSRRMPAASTSCCSAATRSGRATISAPPPSAGE
ncbi:hypothetical protein DAH66_15065 [Sphingomonas koreensis]|uniref:Uncharacterized protein n=1 Tax=Sphingomonas koreensis TaxID=93064 RepID=A0A430G0X0_9SPHN|nr:hypothetical protein DAH66_15065 [Sphingomonas koreensis]